MNINVTSLIPEANSDSNTCTRRKINMQHENCTDCQLAIGPSNNFLSHIGTRCVSSYMAYAILQLVPTWLKVLTWSGTYISICFKVSYEQKCENCAF